MRLHGVPLRYHENRNHRSRVRPLKPRPAAWRHIRHRFTSWARTGMIAVSRAAVRVSGPWFKPLCRLRSPQCSSRPGVWLGSSASPHLPRAVRGVGPAGPPKMPPVGVGVQVLANKPVVLSSEFIAVINRGVPVRCPAAGRGRHHRHHGEVGRQGGRRHAPPPDRRLDAAATVDSDEASRAAQEASVGYAQQQFERAKELSRSARSASRNTTRRKQRSGRPPPRRPR